MKTLDEMVKAISSASRMLMYNTPTIRTLLSPLYDELAEAKRDRDEWMRILGNERLEAIGTERELAELKGDVQFCRDHPYSDPGSQEAYARITVALAVEEAGKEDANGD